MKLADLRKLAIRRQIQIRFRLRNGLECVVTEHGVAQVPDLKGVPDFNLEEELASAATFVLDPVASPKAASKGTARVPEGTSVGREELSGMTASGPATEAAAHDDD